jgi:hypothetical protein
MPRNPHRRPCHVTGCRAWAMRSSDPPTCVAHAGRKQPTGTFHSLVPGAEYEVEWAPRRGRLYGEDVARLGATLGDAQAAVKAQTAGLSRDDTLLASGLGLQAGRSAAWLRHALGVIPRAAAEAIDDAVEWCLTGGRRRRRRR